MLSGNWKNYDELEEHLSYPELVAMVKAQRDRDERMMKFHAAIQGIDLDKDKKEEDDPVERIKREVRAAQMGVTEEDVRFRDAAHSAGFAVITE